MESVIANQWVPGSTANIELSDILDHKVHPEGLDFRRIRFIGKAEYRLEYDCGAFVSVLKGELDLRNGLGEDFHLRAGVHLYMPASWGGVFFGQSGCELLVAESPTAKRARGKQFLLRDDQFLKGCASEHRSLRWILTPQYLSRRVFLYHDQCLLSLDGTPVSWFHTTMFDVDGLPSNEEGRPVFKMSYNYRTEPNVCYEVSGEAKVRMAEHPYSSQSQAWGAWEKIGSDMTYHLNESVDKVEWLRSNGGNLPRRNKHEVCIENGYVSLICMHNPAATGAERHSEGEYSEYGDLSEVLESKEYQDYLQALRPLDAVLDTLSVAKAKGGTCLQECPEWALFEEGLKSQRTLEERLRLQLLAEGQGRETILAPWMVAPS